VFIHGAFIADAFRPLVAETALQDSYQVILYHRRGYAGSSRASGPVSVDQQAADCRAVLDVLQVERAHVTGHSYGGAIALQLALDAPELVHTLALLEPALAVGESGTGYREALTRSSDRFREAGAAVVLDESLRARSPDYRAHLDRSLPGAFDQAVADAATPFESELPGLLDWRFGEPEARRIHQPTLCVLGGESENLWARFGETHRQMLAWLPQAEEFILPGATHFLQIEKPRDMAEGLAAFWARHPMPAEPA
jgi:pimeloyl-ACP methyl ester carboxylesterase